MKIKPRTGKHKSKYYKQIISAGRTRSGIYRGHYFRRAEELIFWIYSWLHNHKVYINRDEFPRPSYNNRSFVPGFVDEDKVYYEIQMPTHKKFIQSKIDAVIGAGFMLRVISNDELAPMKAFVLNLFKVKHAYELYDDFLVQLEYTCSFCGKKFLSKYKRPTKRVYCSQRCTGRNSAGGPTARASLAEYNRKQKALKEKQ